MTIETDLYATLMAASGVTAITTAITFDLAEENVSKPYIVLNLVSGTKIDTLTGVSDMDRKVMQISCRGDTRSSVKTLAAAVIAALEGNGYKQLEIDYYDPDTRTYSTIVDWSYLA